MKQDTPSLPLKPTWEVLDGSGPVCEDGFCSIDDAPKPAPEQQTGTPREKTEKEQP